MKRIGRSAVNATIAMRLDTIVCVSRPLFGPTAYSQRRYLGAGQNPGGRQDAVHDTERRPDLLRNTRRVRKLDIVSLWCPPVADPACTTRVFRQAQSTLIRADADPTAAHCSSIERTVQEATL